MYSQLHLRMDFSSEKWESSRQTSNARKQTHFWTKHVLQQWDGSQLNVLPMFLLHGWIHGQILNLWWSPDENKLLLVLQSPLKRWATAQVLVEVAVWSKSHGIMTLQCTRMLWGTILPTSEQDWKLYSVSSQRRGCLWVDADQLVHYY